MPAPVPSPNTNGLGQRCLGSDYAAGVKTLGTAWRHDGDKGWERGHEGEFSVKLAVSQPCITWVRTRSKSSESSSLGKNQMVLVKFEVGEAGGIGPGAVLLMLARVTLAGHRGELGGAAST